MNLFLEAKGEKKNLCYYPKFEKERFAKSRFELGAKKGYLKNVKKNTPTP